MQKHAKTRALPLTPFKIALSFMLLVAAFYLIAPAHAISKQERFDMLYQQMLRNPADVDLTLAYAKLAVEMNDYEAAIPPLERLLLTAPTPRLKLEIGILYFLLDSHEVARDYFMQVKNSNAPDTLKTQADDYLERM